jgi:F-type H+-transporting ATPase subunit delta
MAGLSVRYATALFELTLAGNTVDESFDQAVFLRDTLKDADCQRVIAHPRIPEGEKIAFFENAFAGKVNNDLLGLVSLAIKKDRESILVSALTAYIDMVNRHKKRTTAYVTSASVLSEAQIAALEGSLTKKLDKQVSVVAKQNPKFIGGFTVFVDGYLIDRTLKKQLSDLKKDISAIQI